MKTKQIKIIKLGFTIYLMFLLQIQIYGNNDKSQYLNISSNYNFVSTPSFLNHTFSSWGQRYNFYFKNNFSFDITYTVRKKNISYKGGISFESFFMSSDIAIGPSECATSQYEKISFNGKGTYLCIANGVEVFPIKKIPNISFGLVITTGYSPFAFTQKEVIGCYGSVTSKRPLFIGSSFQINGYIPLKNNWDLFLNLRYQIRGDHIDFFTHVDYGFGIGFRFKIIK